MRTPRLFLFWGFLTGVTAGLASATPPSSIVEPVSEARDDAGFTFRVSTPALLLSNLPDGSTQIRIDGFPGRQSRPGVPDLPFTVVHVAIPFGVTPRLVVQSVVEDRMPGTIPQPVARLSAELAPDVDELDARRVETRVKRERVLDPDPAFFRGRAPYPEQIARLGEIGTFRDQRYVDVFIAPVRFDPSFRGLRVARSVTVKIAFDGDTGARGVPSADPRIEDLYRDMFANYAQGTTFRVASSPVPSLMAATAPLVGPRYRIRVRANGPIRLDFAKLTGTGFESQPLSSYKLTDRGVEVPLLVFDANLNDQLEAGDWVQFYGQALDDDPKTMLNTEILGGTSIYTLNDVTDENVYFLTTEPGSRSRLTTRNEPPNLSSPATKFDAVAHLETDNAFRPLAEADPWYWLPSQQNPPTQGGVSTRTLSIPLPGLASGTDPVRVLVRLRGQTEDSATPNDHLSRVALLNGTTQLLMQDDGSFDGRSVFTQDFTWTYPGSGNVITSPGQLKIDALAVAGSTGYKNNFILDFAELHYKRSFQAAGDALTFDFPDGDAEFLVTGLTTNVPEVWEITGKVGATGVAAPVRVTGGTIGGSPGNYSVRFHMANDPGVADGAPRRFVVAGTNAVAEPAAADFTTDTVSDLRNTSNQADLIVITHPTVLGPTSTSTLNSLLAWKLTNLGITSKVVMIQDVYDEFGDGLETPQAIKNFLAFTLSTNPGEGWSGRKPAWVLLIGDGSYDTKHNDTSVPDESNFIPTQILLRDDPAFGYYASDSLLANVAGSDLIPDLVIGRVSTRNDAQTATVLQKFLDYAQSPPAGNWRRHAVFVSDRGKNYSEAEAMEWEATNALGRSHMKIPPHTARMLRYWTDYCGGTALGCTPAKIELLRSDVKKAVNGTDSVSDGASMMQYTGHGNFNVWSDDAFFAEDWNGTFDVNNLINGGKLPWLLVNNCLSGGFMDIKDLSLGEDWLKRPGGGAVAVFAPSGLTDAYYGSDITDQIWGGVFGNTKDRLLGTAAARSTIFMCGLGVVQPCQNYVLLGDPTTRLIIPSVNPATAVVATGGSNVVNLSWTASTTPLAKYDVYRKLNTAMSYTKLNASLIATNAYVDTTAINTKTYYYYVVASDTEGFESRWSNYNSDCAVSGPDCVSATPLNPNPPAVPSGLTVVDAETGGKLLLSWTANGESDLDHYNVRWGTDPGSYTFSANAGKMTTYSLTGLVNGTTYYIALTATNTSAQTSAPSTEKTGVPTYVRGLRSPDFVSSLKIDKSGANALLTWAPVTTDIYGKPATIASYEVFRGTTPIFVPGPGNKIGQPLTATFTDPGALSVANPNYHYLVRAIDVNGNVGGMGNQLPNGIDTVSFTSTPDGLGGFTLTITWPAVTTDFDGLPLSIHLYEVYGRNTPFSRADIANGLVPLLASPASTSFSVTAPAANQYYSVLAVDARGNKSPF